MSLATRCTACGTIFRVVQDQLKVSEGWVRCGRCQEVFNALESLFDLEREAPPQRVERSKTASATEVAARAMEEFIASQQPPMRRAEPDEAALPATHEDDAIESRFLARPSDGTRRADEDVESEHPDFADARFPSELPLDAALDDAEGTDSPPPSTEAAPTEPPREGLSSVRQRWRERRARNERERISSLFETSTEEAAASAGGTAPAPYDPASGVAPGFVRQAEDAARWQRPRVRASLVVAGLLLLGMLTVQAAVHFRDALATYRPDAREGLQTLCDIMGCSIGPLRRLSALTVEASGLTRVEGSPAYRLSLTLNNRGDVPLAPPAIDLALTDGSGALIARRALLPRDFRLASGAEGDTGQPLAPGAESQWQALLSTGGTPVNGYTVELFYP